MENLLIAMRFVQFLAMMILFGSALYPYYALPDRASRAEFAVFMRRLALLVGMAGLISALAWLSLEAAAMSGNDNAWHDFSIITTILNETEFGGIWRLRLILLTALPVILIWRIATKRAPSSFVPLLFGVVLLASLAGVGHGAMGLGFSEWVHLGNQAVHFLAAAVWVGGLYPLYLTLARRDYDFEIKRRVLRRFSAVGFWAVLLILASGLLNSWFLVGSIHALVFTLYGRVLMLKVFFFLCMVALALFNRLFLMPRLNDQTPGSLRSLLRTVAAEQILAILVVATVSVLGNLPPAMDRMMM
jgi:putative copper resistance protein D